MLDMVTADVDITVAGDRPVRIQRSRAKGWRKPDGSVIVSRPSKWGNPFKVGGWVERGDPNIRSGAEAIGHLASLIAMRAGTLAPGDRPRALPSYPTLDEIRRELRGKDLVCWCSLDQLCHADVLIELANEGIEL